jgi:hypothetical protein
MKHHRIPLGIFFTLLVLLAPVAAQSPQPHVQALRQQLQLSSNLQLKWQPSTTGPDSVRVIDDFNRANIGSDWLLDDRFWAIENHEIVLNDSSPSEWRYLALFRPVFNTVARKIYSVSYRWGQQADSIGIGEGSFALLINKHSYKGDAYWLWRRTNQRSVWLYAIKNGTWEYAPGTSKEYNRADARLPIPKAGDVITAVLRNEVHSMFFDYYINGRWDATVQDTSKEFARKDTSYFGLFMHGQNLNNMADDFTLTWLTPDTIPPAAINDLRAVDSSLTSITLAWTATGDNYWDGQASAFDLRYATFPISPANFSLATPAANLPPPAASGVGQQFTVSGLQSSSRYYFALRVYDELQQTRGLSNVAEGVTLGARVATVLQLLEGCGQTGRVGATLSQPLVVAVLDQFHAPFAGYAVRFAVKSGEANFANGASELVLDTDGNGRAQTEIRLGTITGAIEIEITAANLSNSPLLCNAAATSGAPAELLQVSGNFQLLSAGKKAAALVVRATDQFGNSAESFPTRFAVAKGGGRFANGSATYSTSTAANGVASAELFASEVLGDTTNVAVTLHDSLSNAQLQTSFMIFTAAADSLLALGGDQQTDTVSTQLEEPLRVGVFDVLGAAAKNFPVTFEVIEGGGVLGNGSAVQIVATDSAGAAQTTWTLGPAPGLNRVAAEAAGLKGSPVTFHATGLGVSAVHDRASEVPKEFALLQNSPNPFSVNGTSGNPETTIRFALPEAAELTLTLYDVNGRVVRVLLDAALPAGEHRARWNGREANHGPAHTGVYFYRLHGRGKTSGKNFQATRKLVLAK